jgi:parallel beta-helix repeat protein
VLALLAVVAAGVAVGLVVTSGGTTSASRSTTTTTTTRRPATTQNPAQPHTVIPADAVPISDTANAQSVVDAHGGGTTFALESGVHPDFQVKPKSGDTFFGEPGVVLDGANTTASAFFAYGSSPSGPGPSNITIQGYSASSRMVVRNYDDGGSEQMGAIQPTFGPSDPTVRADHWVLRWTEVTASYSRGVTTSDDSVIDGCLIDHNGRLGVGGSGNRVTLENSEVSYNDTRNVPSGVENGGAKFSLAQDLLVTGNYIHDNTGPGIWTDIDSIRSTISNNTLVNNSGAGILNEISHNTVISGNRITGNGATHNGLFGAGIIMSTSDNAQVFGNTLSDNGNGITAIQQNRHSGIYGPRLLNNLSVHDNSVTNSGNTGVGEDIGDLGVFSRNLRFTHNTYQGETFAWMGQRGLSWGRWQGYGQDPDGSWSP